jgi:superfamily II DNA or RNA helicase
MDRLEVMNRRQDEGIDAWASNNYVGTLNMAVGTGKTITAFKAIIRAIKDGKLAKGDKVRFMAETDARWITVEEEIEEFKKHSGIWIRDIVSLDFKCYQGLPAWDGSAMDVYDEIHCALSAQYHLNIKNSGAKLKLGLSATIPEDQTVFPSLWPDEMMNNIKQSESDTSSGKITDSINKGQLCRILCPIVYRYTIESAIKDGVLADFKTYVIFHDLDNLYPYVKTKFGVLTEHAYYSMLSRSMAKFKAQGNSHMINSIGRKMTSFLYEIKSKTRLVKAMLFIRNRPSIIFGMRIATLKYITPNVATANVVKIVEDFNSGKISTIATVKKLKQGITLKGVEDGIFHSYTSRNADLIQQLGRVIRWAPDKKGSLYIIVTRGTLEEKWFRKMQNHYGESLNLSGRTDLKIAASFIGSDIIEKAKKLKDEIQQESFE